MTVRRPLLGVVLAIVLSASICVTAAQAKSTASPRTKHRAERDVLRAIPRFAHRAGVAALIDAQSGLLKDNVQISCKGRGKRYRGGRRASFVCSIRPAAKQRITVRVVYRGARSGTFHLRWLRVRHT